VSYEAVPLAMGQDGTAVLRRRSARPSSRAVVYVLCAGDDFVTDDVVTWYTGRGFHFYAADLREVGRPGRSPADAKVAAEDLGECFRCLDAAAAHLRDNDDIAHLVVCGHGSGALIAALWCHARRGSRPADALILARPDLGGRAGWRPPVRALRPRRKLPGGDPAARRTPLIAGARRRVRQGLDIACPVLVMCPAAGWEVPGGAGGLLGAPALVGGRATIRLGEHVTWLKMAGGLPGEPPPGRPPYAAPLPAKPLPAVPPASRVPPRPQRRRFFDELGRWLGAYLSGEIRDQLL
jgi:hypothetical protein